jgi:hypothetical protein
LEERKENPARPSPFKKEQKLHELQNEMWIKEELMAKAGNFF